VTWRGQLVVDVPPGSLADDGPVSARPMREPNDRILLAADRAETLPRPRTGDDLRATLLRLAASPNLCDKTWVTEQYDRYVLGNTVLAQPEDAGVIRVDEETGLGIALSVDGNGRFARLDPYQGAKLALAEAYRNVAVTGAVPLAVTNCLNFGSPEDPAVMWQFAEAVRGLADGCQELGIPVTGGNVSFYNQTGAAAIHPTPIVGVLGVLEDVGYRTPMGFSADGDVIVLLGDTRAEFSGSEWAWVVHEHLGGQPPALDLKAEKKLAGLLADAAVRGHVGAAHDLSDGGLAQALVESCLRYGLGATLLIPDEADPFTLLFSESTGRALVSVPRGHEKAFLALCVERGVPYTPLGVVDARSAALDVRGLFRFPLAELRDAWSATLPTLFGAAPAAPAASVGETASAGEMASAEEMASAAPAEAALADEPAEAEPADEEPADAEPSDAEPDDAEATEPPRD
jgi:phosphoribosylformylglycinamidine synthase